MQIAISELYRHGDLRCHRINIDSQTAGELLLKVPQKQEPLFIEEVFIDQKYRHMGLGSKLLSFAEDTACGLGVCEIELRPFSIDPTVSDSQLKEWYFKRGYVSNGARMSKRINIGVIS